MKLGQTEEAIRYLMAARTIRPDSAHDLAHLLNERGESDEAIAVFRDLVRLRPDDGSHWGCYGKLLKERGDRAGSTEPLEKAVAILRGDLQLKPEDAEAHHIAWRYSEVPGEAGGGDCRISRRDPPRAE